MESVETSGDQARSGPARTESMTEQERAADEQALRTKVGATIRKVEDETARRERQTSAEERLKQEREEKERADERTQWKISSL